MCESVIHKQTKRFVVFCYICFTNVLPKDLMTNKKRRTPSKDDEITRFLAFLFNRNCLPGYATL